MDVTALSDDGNPGTANAFKFGGIPLGIVVVLCELMKGCIPVYLAAHRLGVENWMFSLCMIAPIIGHAHSLFVPGKGGKAIAVSFGVLIGLYPIVEPLEILIFFYLFYSLVVVINPHLFRSMVTFICYSIGCVLTVHNSIIVLGCLRLEDIMKKLNRWYDFEVAYEEEELKDLRFSGAAEKYNPVEFLLKMIEEVTKVRFDIEGKRIMVKNN